MNVLKASIIGVFLCFVSNTILPCTNYIVTRGASSNNSVMITYAADSHTRYGALYFHPCSNYPSGTMLDIFHYESGKYLGQIPQVQHTYNVIGFMNEKQVAIGETTWGGRDSLQSQPNAILDYGSLMTIALQRSSSAREAIKTMVELSNKYGYATSGESFSVSDSKEAWIFEIIGKGKYEKGIVWVALKIPDGYISGHANQARITAFPIMKKNNWNDTLQICYHAPDVISFARTRGWFKGKDVDFSFSDTYNPINFGGARFCDARVWTFFRKYNAQIRNNSNYTEYAKGNILYDDFFSDGNPNPLKYPSNRLPLWVKPDATISLTEMMNAMRDHYEDTPLDMRYGTGAGPFNLPYRWRPMEFKVDDRTYLHERAVATQQTGFCFVAQSRTKYPDVLGGIFWFGVDDADGCVFTPFYCGISEIPSSYTVGNGSMIEWSDDAAFWTFSQVNHLAYSKYNYIHPEIEEYQKELEQKFITETEKIEKETANKKMSHEEIIKHTTQFSTTSANELIKKWKKFYQYLFMKYLDGNLKKCDGFKLLDNGNNKGVPQKPSHPGYGDEWNRKMMDKTGERYIVPTEIK